MKRLNNLYPQICSLENIQLADYLASRGKSKQYGVLLHRKNQEANIAEVRRMLTEECFRTSAYGTFTIYEPKERLIFSLPYYPDRIVHHAVMNILEQVFTSMFTADTYSCIKGKGIHAAVRNLKTALKDEAGTQYCLKMDIRKFYPSIDHGILKTLLRRKFKDAALLRLLDGIIDSAPGIPIGNYLSQYFANFYLCYFDHWIKEELRVKYYFRYADDLVFLSGSKDHLHQILSMVRDYLATKLNLQVKRNYQIFPVAARGLDFIGYRFYHTHVLLRKSIKKSFARTAAGHAAPASIAAYKGWAKHCNSRHLLKILLHEKL